MNTSEDEYALYYKRVHGKPPPMREKAEKRHKYNAKRAVVDGLIFPSKWEATCYIVACWRYAAGEITEPLLHVRFSLGVHYGKERVYISDLVWIDLRTGCLVVADAKGVRTKEFLQKKAVFETLYNMQILELRDNTAKEKQAWTKRTNGHKKK